MKEITILNKATLSLIGACLIKFSTSMISTWGNINLYILSYFHEQGYMMNESTSPALILLIVFPMIVATLFATKISRKLGFENSLRLFAFLSFLSPLISAIFFRLQIFLVFSIIIPASCFVIIAIPTLNIMWRIFPLFRNTVTALLVVCYGIGSMFWNTLFLHLINPNNESASKIEGNMHYFPPSVTANVKRATVFNFLIAGIITIIGSFLIKQQTESLDVDLVECGVLQDNMQVKQIDKIKENKQEESEKKEKQEQKQSQKQKQKQKEEERRQDNISQRYLLKNQTIKDLRFILTFLITFLLHLYEIHLLMNLKIIFIPIINDDHFLTYASMLFYVISILGTFFWGWLGDHKGVAFSLLFVTSLDLVTKIYSNFAFSKSTIVFSMILLGFISKSIPTLTGPGFVEFFGLQIGTEILPYKGVALLTGFIIVPFFQIITSSILTAHSYLVVLSFISIFTFVMSIKLYQIGKKENIQQK